MGRLRQVLINLVGNAIKFTAAGEVAVEIALADAGISGAEAGGEVCLSFTVRDTGIGIAPEKREKIFEAFEQGDSSTTRSFGGTGLGLTIAARIVDLMGGRILVESEPGRGSSFEFSARLATDPARPVSGAKATPEPLVGQPVLIVEKNATTRGTLERWLRGCGMDPTAACDAATAVECLRRGSGASRPFEFVIVDGRMSNQGGLDAVEEIAIHPASPRRRILILGSGDLYDPAQARRLDIAARLLKPVMEDELRDAIRRAMDGLEEEQPVVVVPSQTPGSATCGGRPLRILVVEDNEFNQEVLSHLLTSRRHVVSIARDGLEAISLLGREAFDLMLLDIHLPGLDGFEVVRRLRAEERRLGRSGRLPVITLTARARPGDRELCLESGMDDYLTKPLRTAELWTAVDRASRDETLTSRRRRGASRLSARLCSSPPAATTTRCSVACAAHSRRGPQSTSSGPKPPCRRGTRRHYARSPTR